MRVHCLLVCVCLLTGVLPAQDYRGSILGRVTDAIGALVPGVSITVVNEGTNIPSPTLSKVGSRH